MTGLWTWRRSPLCRRTDLTEAWLALCAVVLLVVGAPLAGLAGGLTAHGELAGIVREQRLHRHPVWATARQPVTVGRPLDGPGSARPDERRGGYPVLAFWKPPDGARRTGTVQAVRPVRPGERFRVWTDDHGALTAPPLSADVAAAHSVAAGLVAGVLSGIAVEAGRRAAVRRLQRRRHARWDEEWARIGPDWGRAGSNN